MRAFFDEPRQTAGFHIYFYRNLGVHQAAQDFLPSAYLKYVEGGKSRRTQLIGKRTINRLETLAVGQQQSYLFCISFVNEPTFAQGTFSFGCFFS